MVDAEDLYGGTGRQGVTDLLHGRKLPIWFSAHDIYRQMFEARLRCLGSKFDAGGEIIELHICFIECPERWGTVNELGESWAVKIDLIEERRIQGIELRGVDEGDEVL